MTTKLIGNVMVLLQMYDSTKIHPMNASRGIRVDGSQLKTRMGRRPPLRFWAMLILEIAVDHHQIWHNNPPSQGQLSKIWLSLGVSWGRIASAVAQSIRGRCCSLLRGITIGINHQIEISGLSSFLPPISIGTCKLL